MKIFTKSRVANLRMVKTQSVLDINNSTKDKLENEIHNKLRDITEKVNDI